MNPDTLQEAHDHGLGTDLERMIRLAAGRRRALRWLVGGGASFGMGACGGGGGSDEALYSSTSGTGAGGSGGSDSGGGGSSSTCSVIPEETNGPYPGDGSNSNASGVANALLLSGIVRSDLRSSLGGSLLQVGVPLTLKLVLVLVNTNASCATLEGFAIYAWHCNQNGLYSMYSSGVTDQTWLRGVQATDAGGTATFTTVFPGCYLGRMPHVHFEVYRSLTTATSFSNRLKTSQVAFPTDTCDAVYATSGYAASKSNFAQISFATDNVFSDGYATQLAGVTGDADSGFVATLEVGISV